MDRSLVIGLASFALTASLLAIPAIASQDDANEQSASAPSADHAVGRHAQGPLSREQMETRLAVLMQHAHDIVLEEYLVDIQVLGKQPGS